MSTTISEAIGMALTRFNMLGQVFSTAPMVYGRRPAGISMAQQKRTSLKKRNRARHKAHC